MSSSAVHDDVERLARELCASEGWDPDETIACDPSEAVTPRKAGSSGSFCARWEPYAMAAKKMIAARDDDWDTF
jgi:ABC-type nitrate/sulfonate/bicarbonate transport system substrate-binding protein